MARRRQRRNPLALLSSVELEHLLNRTVAGQLRPGQQEIDRQRADARNQSMLDQQRARDSAAGLAQLLGKIAPQIQGDYQAASGAQAAFGRGLGNLQNQIQTNDAAKAGSFLSKVAGAGSDQIAQVQGQGRGVGDTSYALGGQIPADMLNTQSAAFTAAARQLPASALFGGQREASQIGLNRQKKETELDAALRDLMAKAPGLRAQDYRDLLNMELQKQAADTQQQYLGVRSNYYDSQTRKNTAVVTGTDPVTGQPVYNPKNNGNKQVLAARAARTSGFADARTKAFDRASILVKGTKVADPTSLDGSKIQRPTYQQAYNVLYNQYGLPLMKLAPKGQQTWWKRQIAAMVRKAIETSELAAGVQLLRPPKRGKRSSNASGPPRGR